MRSLQYVYYLFQTNIFTRPMDQSSHRHNVWASNKDLSVLNWTNRPEISVQWWDLYNMCTICFKLTFLLDHWPRVHMDTMSERQIRISLFWAGPIDQRYQSMQWWDLYNKYTICFKLLFFLDHWTRVHIDTISEPQIRNSLFWTGPLDQRYQCSGEISTICVLSVSN